MDKMSKQILIASTLSIVSSTTLAVPVYTSNLSDVMTDMGLGHYDVVNDQAQSDYWSHSAGGVNSQFVFTDVNFGSGSSDSLGIFSYYTGEQLELFDHSGTASASVSFLSDGSAYSVQFDSAGLELNQTTTAGFGDLFGYYVTTGSGTFYSDSSKNQSYTTGGDTYSDWMIAFQGDGSVTNDYNGFSGGTFGTDDWLIAFDGPTHGPGLLDFNDAVFLVESVQPHVVPVPAAVWLFGSGLLGLVGVARRKKA